MVLDAALLNTKQYKATIKGKVEQFRELSSTLLYTCVEANEKGAFGLPSTKVANFTFLYVRECVGVHEWSLLNLMNMLSKRISWA